jgi:hypothetical protein
MMFGTNFTEICQLIMSVTSSLYTVRMVKSRRLRWTGHGEMRNAYKILVGKLEGKRPLRRPRHR